MLSIYRRVMSRFVHSFIVFLLFAAALPVQAQVNLSQGLVAYYPFNGSAADASGHNHDGTLMNGVQPAADRFGNAGGAYQFDGVDDYISIPDAADFHPPNAFSVALYFNAAQNTAAQTLVGKISYTQGTGTQFQVGVGYSAQPGVFFGLNPPTLGCSNQTTVNTSYVHTGDPLSLSQWHCLVTVFDQGSQRIYLDGVLMQTLTTPFTTLNQCSNSDIQVGSWWSFDPQRFKGKIDDLRMYNRALTTDEINALCGLSATNVTPSFTAPDTVCVNEPINITNTTTGASSYFWNFCVADVNTPPVGVNLGNPGNYLSQPVFVDLASDNGNYYGFVVNHVPGGITRLDFGNSLLNTPNPVFLGNISNVMNPSYGSEGIQIVKNNGNWYGIVVGGSPTSGSTPKLIIISFGPNLNNPSPTAISYGNVGTMQQPIDLHVFQENGNWYGLTVNAETNTITRFDFTNSFTNTPTGVNLGNIGQLNYPTGVCAVNDNGYWRVYVANQNSSSITRLDFGSSLLNTPTGVNLGNPGGALSSPRDLTILNYCGQSVGFVSNGTGSIARLNFSSLSAVPTGTNLGNIGTLNFPHSLSKLFRVGNDIYSLITNVNSNTITRLKFSGCTASSVPNSATQTPPQVSYSAPGTYNINLTVDDGLPTQAAFCKQVTVLGRPGLATPLADVSICPGNSVPLNSQFTGATTYSWSPTTGLSNPNIATPIASPTSTTQYIVTASNGKCTITDTVLVNVLTPAQCAANNTLAGFNVPDTVCVNTPVTITNTSVNATSYFWNFCVADLSSPPTGSNLGNIGNNLNNPVFMDYALYNGNYYGFVVDYNSGHLIRLDFGGSLLNTPSSIDLGNFGGIIPPGLGGEGIQLVFNEGRWYAIIVGGYTPSGSSPRILKIDFGPILSNSAPTATNWGNLGNMSQPIDLHVFKEANNWYGFTVNAENNSITRFNFTSSFNSVPTAQNLGNIGGLSYPTGIYAINDDGFWRVFIVNAGNGDRTSGVFSLTRLDFGLSLLNTPTGVNLGNPGNMLHHPRDLTIIKMCDHIVGFAVNGHPSYNNIVRLDFGSGLDATPVITSLGNIGTLNFPHSISRLFRVGNDIYSFVTNVASNSITRLRFSGCANSSLSSSSLQSPPAVSYDQAGSYNINLTIDDGLPTQNALCKHVVVIDHLPHAPTQHFFICPNSSIKIGTPTASAAYLWSSGEQTDSITVSSAGTYWIQISKFGCAERDSFIVEPYSKPLVDFGFTQNICAPKTLQFTTSLPGSAPFVWDFGNGQFVNNILAPTVIYSDFGTYQIKLKYQYGDGCADSISRAVTIDNTFDDQLLENTDTTICLGDSVLIRAGQDIADYCWHVNQGIASIPLGSYIKPVANSTYVLTSHKLGPNLLENPDFSAGNIGFMSDYSNVFPNSAEGQYWVGNTVSGWNNSMSNCGDHTNGAGGMLMLNGASNANARVWFETVAVTPNTNYNFSAWLSSLNSASPGQLKLVINGADLGTGIGATNITCAWKQFSSFWNSGNNTSATIALFDANTTTSGNDFGLDDLYFGTVTAKTDSFNVAMRGLCDSVKIAGPVTVCSVHDTITYNIYRAQFCTQQFVLQVDPNIADIVAQTSTSLRLVFRTNGTTTIKVGYGNDCKIVLDSLQVNIKLSPDSISFGPDIITCRDTSFLLHAGAGFETYSWQDRSTDSLFSVSAPGQYEVTAVNFCGRQMTDTIKLIRFSANPFGVSPETATVCAGDSITFKAKGGSSYDWMPVDIFDHPHAQTATATVNNSISLQLHIVDDACGRDTLINIPISVSAGPSINVSKSNDVTCANDSSILVASGASAYTWSPQIYISRSQNAQITVKPPQTTTYYIAAKDEIGCVAKDSVTVYFIKTGDQKLYVPNAFTPNGDGLNDVFRPTFIGPAEKYEFRVYNRWGQLIFKSVTPGEGWDGTFHSKLAPGDAYIYYVTAEGGCNGKFFQKGAFVLIR